MILIFATPYCIAGMVTTIPIGMQKVFSFAKLAEGKVDNREYATIFSFFILVFYSSFFLIPKFIEEKDKSMALFVIGNLSGLFIGVFIGVLLEGIGYVARRVF